MNTETHVNGHLIPASILSAIECGAWIAPEDLTSWYSLFSAEEVVQPLLYRTLKSMQASTDWLINDAGQSYYGELQEEVDPGIIDPAMTVLIGDLGPDRLIALDYRHAETRPFVIALSSSDSSWRHVAKDVESFMRSISIIK